MAHSLSARFGRLTDGAARQAAAADLAAMFMGSTLVTPLYTLYREEFGFSELTLTLVYSAYVVGNIAALFLLGRLSDQIGRRRTALPAIGTAIVATLVFLSATDTAWLFVGRALSGLAIGLASGAGTAWIAELTEHRREARASMIATGSNFIGLAVGALLSGVLAQYAPAPLHLSYLVYLTLLATIALLVSRTEETVRRRAHSLGETHLRPRIGVPRGIRGRFLSPAMTAFATFALSGFYAALAPTVLSRDLDVSNLAAGAAIVFELFGVAALTVFATRGIDSRTGMLGGAAVLVPSVVLLVIAQALESLPILAIGTAVSGVSAALGYRGSLQVINEIAPEAKRAEVISSFQIVCFTGNAVPIVGVGIVSAAWGPMAATVSLAAVTSVLAVAALAIELTRAAGR